MACIVFNCLRLWLATTQYCCPPSALPEDHDSAISREVVIFGPTLANAELCYLSLWGDLLPFGLMYKARGPRVLTSFARCYTSHRPAVSFRRGPPNRPRWLLWTTPSFLMIVCGPCRLTLISASLHFPSSFPLAASLASAWSCILYPPVFTSRTSLVRFGFEAAAPIGCLFWTLANAGF